MVLYHYQKRCENSDPTAQFFKLFILNWKSNSSFSPNSIGPGEKKDVDFDFKIDSWKLRQYSLPYEGHVDVFCNFVWISFNILWRVTPIFYNIYSLHNIHNQENSGKKIPITQQFRHCLLALCCDMYHRWCHFGTLPPHSGDGMVLHLDFLIHKIVPNIFV